MTDQDPSTVTAAADVPNWTVMVLLSRQKRVRHIAVWGEGVRGRPGTLCRNRGDFPNYGYLHEFPGVPICTRCADEAHMIDTAIKGAE